MRREARPEVARVLIVDDEEANVRLLERALANAGYANVLSTTDPREFRDLFGDFEPDVVLLDLLMPYLDGFAILDLLREVVPLTSYLPVLVLTADVTRETKRRALAAGAKDFLTKPFDIDEVLLRIRNMLETRRLHLQLQAHNQLLERRVRRRTRELEEAHVEMLERLALAAEYRDDDTGQHTRRVGRTAGLLARELGLGDSEVETIERAAALHDVGKIGVPDTILLKPGKLTTEEFEVVKTHTVIGAKILSGSRSQLLRMAEEVAWAHHERWDGSGYAGLAREEIPLSGRIASLADVFDALTHVRPYKEAWPVERAIAEIEDQAGKQFDPELTEAFLSVQEHAAAIALGQTG